MALAYERVQQLRKWLDLSQRRMMARIGLTGATYSMWKPGKQEPSLDSLYLMADAWQVSLDSLIGRGTGIEPSPDLRAAQGALAARLVKNGDVQGTATERLRLCWTLLTAGTETGELPLLPQLSEAAWLDWIHWDAADWQAALEGRRAAGPHQLRGAARLLGWREAESAWFTWLSTGNAWDLAPVSERAWRQFYEAVTKSGWDLVDVRRAVQAQGTADHE